MVVDLTCLNNYPQLPIVPITANTSSNAVHPSYKPDSGGIAQIISASLARSTFSINDVESVLKKYLNKNFNSWNASEIMKTKPITSIIIYTSIALGLFLMFSLTFCINSCRNSNKNRGKSRRTTSVCVCLLTIVYLLGIGDMIYVAYRVNKSKSSIDDTIKVINRDIYPKEISEHMKYLIQQFEKLDQYSTESNSIFINASKSILVKKFDEILKGKYFIGDIFQTVNSIDGYVKELNETVNNQTTLPPIAKQLFQQFQQQYQDMINYVELPLKELCNYANGTHNVIDKKLIEALDVIHIELRRLIDTIDQDVLNEITPWQNHMLINIDLEEDIRSYINLGGTIFLVLVIVLGVIPIGFFIIILISRLCNCDQHKSSNHKRDGIRMNTVSQASDISPTNAYSESERYYRRTSSIRNSGKIRPDEERKSREEEGQMMVHLVH